MRYIIVKDNDPTDKPALISLRHIAYVAYQDDEEENGTVRYTIIQLTKEVGNHTFYVNDTVEEIIEKINIAKKEEIS